MNIVEIITQFAQSVPLPVFAFVSAFAEEIVSFIPSPLVLTLIGSISAQQNQTWVYLALLIIISSLGKLLGMFIFYQFATYFRTPIVEEWAPKIGISTQETNSIKKYFQNSKSDEVTLIFLRAIPVIPTGPVTLLAGILSLKLSSFLWASFVGLLIRHSFYAIIGYTGSNLLEKYSDQLSIAEYVIGGVLLIILLGAGYWFAKKKLA